jgi:ABC-2 type transport system ATP-binding protein
VISVRGLRKSYGAVEAVRGVDLDVRAGEILAVLGPNGAGKTTTVEILEGYRSRDGGEASVLGVDPARPTREWRARIGVVPQESQVQAELSVRESLEQFAGYYPAPLGVEETIALVGLGDQADTRARRLSGGQQRRLDVALALVGDPELLFLDEPTTGFDPSARRSAWEVIANLRDLGKTILLTTHYMDEAQRLADRVAIISAGRVVAEGPPGQLGARRGATRISVLLPEGTLPGELPDALAEEAEMDGSRLVLRTEAPVAVLHALTGWALERGIDLPELEARASTLEEAYLELTDEP